MKLLSALSAVFLLAGAAIVAPQPASACPPGEGCTIPIPRPPFLAAVKNATEWVGVSSPLAELL